VSETNGWAEGFRHLSVSQIIVALVPVSLRTSLPPFRKERRSLDFRSNETAIWPA
jgi:hypothetical protein